MSQRLDATALLFAAANDLTSSNQRRQQDKNGVIAPNTTTTRVVDEWRFQVVGCASCSAEEENDVPPVGSDVSSINKSNITLGDEEEDVSTTTASVVALEENDDGAATAAQSNTNTTIPSPVRISRNHHDGHHHHHHHHPAATTIRYHRQTFAPQSAITMDNVKYRHRNVDAAVLGIRAGNGIPTLGNSVTNTGERAYRRGIWNAQTAIRDARLAAQRSVLATDRAQQEWTRQLELRRDIERQELVEFVDLCREARDACAAELQRRETAERLEIEERASDLMQSTILRAFYSGMQALIFERQIAALMQAAFGTTTLNGAMVMSNNNNVSTIQQQEQDEWNVLMRRELQGRFHARVAALMRGEASSRQQKAECESFHFREHLLPAEEIDRTVVCAEAVQRRLVQRSQVRSWFSSVLLSCLMAEEECARSRLSEDADVAFYLAQSSRAEEGKRVAFQLELDRIMRAALSFNDTTALGRSGNIFEQESREFALLLEKEHEARTACLINALIRCEADQRRDLMQLGEKIDDDNNLSFIIMAQQFHQQRQLIDEVIVPEHDPRRSIEQAEQDERRANIEQRFQLALLEAEEAVARRLLFSVSSCATAGTNTSTTSEELFFSQLKDEFSTGMIHIRCCALFENESDVRCQMFEEESEQRAQLTSWLCETMRKAHLARCVRQQKQLFSEELAARRAISETECSDAFAAIEDSFRKENATVMRLALLEHEARTSKKSRPFVGFSLVERGSSESFSRRRRVREPLVVDSMYVGGPAHAAGAQLGDTLLKVAGHEAQTLVQVRVLLVRHAKVGSKLRLEFKRNNAVSCVSEDDSNHHNIGGQARQQQQHHHQQQQQQQQPIISSRSSSACSSRSSSSSASSACSAISSAASFSSLANPRMMTMMVNNASGNKSNKSTASSSSLTPTDSGLSSHNIVVTVDLDVKTCDDKFRELGGLFFDTHTHEKLELEELP